MKRHDPESNVENGLEESISIKKTAGRTQVRACNKNEIGGFPGSPVVRIRHFHCCGPGVRSVVRELRYHKPCQLQITNMYLNAKVGKYEQ